MSEPKAIWKFPIDLTDAPIVQMPAGARVLHFGVQDEQLTLWALVTPSAPLNHHRFRLAGTGHPIEEDGLTYVGTCFQGPFVWHLFDLAAS
jgi:hypothetical protein